MTDRRIKNEIVIGSRASKLALVQTELVVKALQECLTDYSFVIKTYTTTGDRILSKGLSAIGEKGLFTKELEIAMINDEIDFAVHSLKDLPAFLPEKLVIGCVTNREDPRDALISNMKFSALKAGAVIGTSALRRRAQLKRIRPDLIYKDIRGNLNTRIDKLDNGLYDAIVVAYAGVKRLALEDRISEVFNYDKIIPPVGQGVLAVECRKNDTQILEMLSLIESKETRIIVDAEREFLKELKGGCQVPLGAYAQVRDGEVIISGFVSDLEGDKFLQDSVSNECPIKAGLQLAINLKARGADEIIEQLTE